MENDPFYIFVFYGFLIGIILEYIIVMVVWNLKKGIKKQFVQSKNKGDNPSKIHLRQENYRQACK